MSQSNANGLRDLVDLPGPFSFKVIVNPSYLGREDVVALIGDTLGRDLGSPDWRATPSKNGKYMSYTVDVHIEVFEEIEKLYAAFKAEKHVVYAM